jgi:hypothetical protein
LPVVTNLLDEERGINRYRGLKIENDIIIYKNSIWSRSSFHAIDGGSFRIVSKGGKSILEYSFFMYWYYLIFFLFVLILAIFNPASAKVVERFFVIYLFMIWVGSLITQRLFFNKIVRKLQMGAV